MRPWDDGQVGLLVFSRKPPVKKQLLATFQVLAEESTSTTSSSSSSSDSSSTCRALTLMMRTRSKTTRTLTMMQQQHHGKKHTIVANGKQNLWGRKKQNTLWTKKQNFEAGKSKTKQHPSVPTERLHTWTYFGMLLHQSRRQQTSSGSWFGQRPSKTLHQQDATAMVGWFFCIIARGKRVHGYNFIRVKNTIYRVDGKDIYKRKVCEKTKRRLGVVGLEVHHLNPTLLGGSDAEESLIHLTLADHIRIHWSMNHIWPLDYNPKGSRGKVEQHTLEEEFIWVTNSTIPGTWTVELHGQYREHLREWILASNKKPSDPGFIALDNISLWTNDAHKRFLEAASKIPSTSKKKWKLVSGLMNHTHSRSQVGRHAHGLRHKNIKIRFSDGLVLP